MALIRRLPPNGIGCLQWRKRRKARAGLGIWFGSPARALFPLEARRSRRAGGLRFSAEGNIGKALAGLFADLAIK